MLDHPHPPSIQLPLRPFCVLVQVIVTVPLAVLKANMVAFSPPLCARKKAAIKNLGAGLVEKVKGGAGVVEKARDGADGGESEGVGLEWRRK